MNDSSFFIFFFCLEIEDYLLSVDEYYFDVVKQKKQKFKPGNFR